VVKDLLTALSHIRTPPVMGLSVSYDDLANAMSGVPANLVGAPMDMAYMMTMQGNYPEMANMVQGRSQRPELREFPMSSDWLGESVGADVDSLPFILSSLVSPDGTDVAIPAAKLAASGRMDDLIQAMTAFTPIKRNGEALGGAVRNTDGYGIDEALLDRLNQVAPDATASLSQKGSTITLNKIQVPDSKRNAGIGSRFMDELTKYADDNDLTIVLTADGDFGGSKAGQQRFYSRHGFNKNAGRNKDYQYTENMIRVPQSK